MGKRKGDKVDGWVVLDKPLGLGSTPAVGRVRRLFGAQKAGHGGTLDPLAEGLLPIALGEATKLAGRMLDSDKIYDFTIAFGAQTDTLDLEGKVIAESDVRPTLAELEAILPRFTGPIEQAPPAYSAILIDGQRAYDLARKGEAVELKSRSVTVHSLEILPAGEGNHEVVEGLFPPHRTRGQSPSVTAQARRATSPSLRDREETGKRS